MTLRFTVHLSSLHFLLSFVQSATSVKILWISEHVSDEIVRYDGYVICESNISIRWSSLKIRDVILQQVTDDTKIIDSAQSVLIPKEEICIVISSLDLIFSVSEYEKNGSDTCKFHTS